MVVKPPIGAGLLCYVIENCLSLIKHNKCKFNFGASLIVHSVCKQHLLKDHIILLKELTPLKKGVYTTESSKGVDSYDSESRIQQSSTTHQTRIDIRQ